MVKNGLPSVSRCNAWASATPVSSIACPAAASNKATTSASLESAQVDALHVLFSMQGREHIGEWMLGGQVGWTVGADNQEPARVGRPDQVSQQEQ